MTRCRTSSVFAVASRLSLSLAASLMTSTALADGVLSACATNGTGIVFLGTGGRTGQMLDDRRGTSGGPGSDVACATRDLSRAVNVWVSGGAGASAPAPGDGGAAGNVRLEAHGTVSADHLFAVTARGGAGGVSTGGGDDRNGGFGNRGGAVSITNFATATLSSSGILVTSEGGPGGATTASGGQGGSGGYTGDVSVTNQGLLETAGTAIGVRVRGGDGGDYTPEDNAIGKAGHGGFTGGVTVENTGRIIARMRNDISDSYGIRIDAVAGSAGNVKAGYSNIAGDTRPISVKNFGTVETYGAGQDALRIDAIAGNGTNVQHRSGNGGNPGVTGDISIENSGTMSTAEASADGVAVESRAGDGGRGGDDGGQGVGGGSAGQIDISNAGAIATLGNFAGGVYAASIAGNGEAGGNDSGHHAVGGNGGNGGRGGNVTLTQTGDGRIATSGDLSVGAHLLSIGGDGGRGGDASASGLFTSLAIGGNGGNGGNGGQITLTLRDRASIETTGDLSHAVLIESIGGGGGLGGSASATSVFSAVAVGGSGGQGGNGGDVRVNLQDHATIAATGMHAAGVLIHTIGGGGGVGGQAKATAISPGISSTIAIGGSGGGGGNGGQVTVTLDAGTSIVTGTETARRAAPAASLPAADAATAANAAAIAAQQGSNSPGLLVQSIGGGGGQGGTAVTQSFSGNPVGSLSLGVAIGGSGGQGGAGGAITATNDAAVTTHSANSAGLLLQSIGGGGGSGGAAASLSGSVGGEFSADLGLVMGGSGGDGGLAGAVSLAGTGRILTEGDNSGAVILQSIAGGGGNGGRSTHIGVSASGAVSANASAAIGGSGGVGGQAGTLTLTFSGDVETRGANATGLLLQSIGGGGGNGGSAINVTASLGGDTAIGASAAIGGGAGAGGSGGVILVHEAGTALGRIVTAGDNSSGLVAQSIGGGGGNGGTAIDVGMTATGGSAFNANVAIGGGGGAGGAGQAVTIKPSGGSITTTGNLSTGIIAQSIGGGGGNGGAAVTVTADLTKAAPTPGSTSNVSLGGGIAFGGGGLAGGTGGTVTIDSGASITTTGSGSLGILAQSIGGGGGNGGAAIAASAVVTQNAQKTYSANIALGGEGGAGATGGTVSVTNRADILTTGDHALGILAQSIGGGGGNGGSSTIAALSLSRDMLSKGQGSQTVSGNVALGGHGSVGGAGGAVTVSNRQSITTLGDHAAAIIAQSVGGGGGNGGASRVLSITSSSAASTDDGKSKALTSSADVSLGGSGGSGGTGGTVTLANAGLITTFGHQSAGMLAQSIGGGGGNGGTSLLLSYTKGSKPKVGDGPAVTIKSTELAVGGNGGTGMHGGTVNATNAGSILTEGAVSAGVLLQSVGGGGGNGGTVFEYDRVSKDDSEDRKAVMGGSGAAAGDGGAVTFTDVKDMKTVIVTKGPRSTGILAQSVGGGGGNSGVVQVVQLIDKKDPDNAPSEGDVEAEAVTRLLGATGAGTGGTGGPVKVTEYGTVQTYGENAHAILAQSIGGGGGTFSDVKTYGAQTAVNAARGTLPAGPGQSGLNASGTYQLGSLDGAAGGARDVSVSLLDAARIATVGALSSGIVAQAISHGGGDVATVSGDDLSSPLAGLPTAHGATTHTLSAILGSRAVSSPLGTGIVTVKLADTAAITTRGDGARGIVAQSIGGGGGLLSANHASAAMASSIPSASTTLTLAGFTNTGTRADGGQVDVSVTGAGIQTSGDFAHGMVGQSIGSGGGIAGVVHDDGITIGQQTLDVLLGSENGYRDGFAQYGWGSTVTMVNTGRIATTGDQAIGVMAQTIGGGGGEVFYDVARGQAIQLNLGLGLGHAIDVRAGDASVTHTGLIATSGDLSHGILAQSVAAGGGLMSIGDLDRVAGGQVSATFGKADFAYGDGYGSANVMLSGGAIRTTGDLAFGVLAQSVGSGGGILSVNGGKTVTPQIILNKGTTGYGSGPVTVRMDAASLISTSGTGSHGIFAQSTTGGGLALLNGTDGFTTNAYDPSQHAVAGRVSVEADGTIETSGAGAHGIFATSSLGPSVVVQADETLSILGHLRDGHANYVGAGQTSTGKISVSGAGASGIYLVSKWRDDVAVDVSVAGTVEASGEHGAGIRTQNTNAMEETGLTDLSDSSTTVTNRIVVRDTGKVLARDPRTATDAIHIVNGLGAYQLSIFGRVAAVGANGEKVQTFGSLDNAVWAAGRGTVDIAAGGGVEGSLRFTGATTVTNSGVIDGAVEGAAAYTLSGAASGAREGASHYLEIRPQQTAAAAIRAGEITLQQGSQIRPYLGEFGTLARPVELLSASRSLTDGGAIIDDTPVLDFSVRRAGNQLWLDRVSADFAGVRDLSANARTIATLADPLVDRWMAGEAVSAEDQALHALLLNAANQTTVAGLDKVISDNTDASGHFGATGGHHAAAISHIGNIHSCGTEYGLYAAISESECTWLKGTQSNSEDLASGTVTRTRGVSSAGRSPFPTTGASASASATT